jgi:hypothetical protein
VPGLPFVFVAKIAGLRGGWALQCARSCCPSYWRYPSIGCQAQILIYISMLYMLFGLGFYVMVNHSFNEISGYISWMGNKSSRIEWQGRWNMRFPLKHAVWCFGKHLYCHPILPHWKYVGHAAKHFIAWRGRNIKWFPNVSLVYHGYDHEGCWYHQIIKV